MSAFIPLRLYSEYSIENSIIRLHEAVEFAQKQQFPALAICDRMNMFSAVKFYNLCRANGIKPILGVDFLIENPLNLNQPQHLVLFAKNYEGYKVLCELLTRVFLENNDDTNLPTLKLSWLTEFNLQDLICLSAAHQGIIGYSILHHKKIKALNWAKQLSTLFKDNFYLEIQRLPNNLKQTDVELPFMQEMQKNAEIVLQGSLELAQELDLPIVASHAIQFMQAEDYIAHETKVCITSSRVLADERRPRNFHPSQYFLSEGEMKELFYDLPDALENTLEIAKRCTLSLDLGHHYLPLFPTPQGMSLDDFLRKQAENGLNDRLEILFPDAEIRKENKKNYTDRLNFELEIIIKMGFSGYFLIVADFINWAKMNHCPVGPGRGSGAGSLVAYSLKITDLDPIKYNLLFERFLNPERVSMPDFDVDFCQENRGRVIDYVRHKYGELAVSQIVTFGTLSSKAVIRDVGRVLGVPFGICDKLSKLIPLETNRPVSLERALELEPDIKKIIKQEDAEALLSLSLKLEDLVRNTGMHAGGVLIAPGKMTDFCPIYKAAAVDSVTVSMFDKDDVEAIGLVKFDFLGLRNLTIIQMAEELILKNRQEQIDISKLELTDPQTFEIFSNANTTAVFQFESTGMKRMLAEAKPTKFEEIIAFVALYRPGPMDLIPDFIKRIKGANFEYLHPLLEPILQPTYGIMVYQEQVMQAAQICAGYSLGGADLLRRAMGKKKISEMIKQRQIFVTGAEKKGIDSSKANEIFDYMERFAGYGFNKSHAAAYALIAYQTAWLKAHYTVEFICATMSSELHNTDQLEVFYEDAKKNNLEFLQPDVNKSFYNFVPAGTQQIHYALGAIKGVGEGAVDAIVKEREKNGAYQDLFDFCGRLDKNLVNKRVLESLIKAGAFDSIDKNRAELFGTISLAMNYAEQKQNNEHQSGLFDFDAKVKDVIPLKIVAEWKLEYLLAQEKEAVGFYLSRHPFEPYLDDLLHIPHIALNKLHKGDNIWLGGFIRKIRSLITKSGKKIWILELDDKTACQEVVINEDVFEQCEFNLNADMAVICQSDIKEDRFNNGALRINIKKIFSIEQAKSKFARHLIIKLNATTDLSAVISALKPFRAHNHALKLKLIYQHQNFESSMLASAEWQIIPKQELLDKLTGILGPDKAYINW